MEIRDKKEYDPVTEIMIVDAYMRWALQAAEEVVGEKGMHVILRQAKLEHLINNYPPNEPAVVGNYSFGDYSNLSAALLSFFGRAGKSMTLRIGRLSAQYAVEQQSAAYGLNTLVKASRVLPLTAQLKAGLMVMQNGFRKLMGEEMKLSVEDRGDKFAYIAETCPICAGKGAEAPICWVHNGALDQSISWLTGKHFVIEEIECRATGDPACVWEVSKKPKA